MNGREGGGRNIKTDYGYYCGTSVIDSYAVPNDVDYAANNIFESSCNLASVCFSLCIIHVEVHSQRTVRCHHFKPCVTSVRIINRQE